MYDNIPVNQRPDYLDHLNKVKECESYLVGKLGFKRTSHNWCSYEFNSVFEQDNLEVRIVYETSLPSSIMLIDNDLPYDESKGLTNVEFISNFHRNSFETVKGKIEMKRK